MAQAFPETAHLKTDLKKYAENHESIFGSKKKPCGWCEDTGLETGTSDRCRRGCELSQEIFEDAKALCPELLKAP